VLTQWQQERFWHLARVITVLLLALVMGTTTGTGYAATPARPQVDGEAATPYQSALEEAIAARRAAGLPVPSSVSFDVQRTNGVQRVGLIQSMDGEPQAFGMQSMAIARNATVTATTVVEFTDPQQAGFDEWPALVVEDNLPQEVGGAVAEGDYTDLYRETLAEQLPGIWDTYEFGQEPRRYTITETIDITYPPEMLVNSLFSVADAVTTEDILMGFTYTGPHIDYAIGDSMEVCLFGICGTVYDFKAGFELDWTMGLRLPAQATLTGPGQMAQGSSYNFTTSLIPLNWTEGQYSAAGVAPENGNEFALRMTFFAGVKGEILGIDLCPSCYAELDFDESESFTTPFGPGAEFPIPSVTIPIYEIDLAVLYFGLGLEIDPHLNSTNITADWETVPGSDCSGSGSVTYTAPNTPVTFGPVAACNYGPSDQAQVQLDNFRYWFSEFTIELLAYLEFEVFGYGVWNPTISITDLDLSSISDDLYLDRHVQCTALFDCDEVGPDNTLLLSIPVRDEAAPTSAILAAGTEGTYGWFRSDTTVTLSAEDKPVGCGVGVDFTEYSLDNVSWHTYSAPFTLATEGFNTVYYRSADEEGNVETTNLRMVNIDRTLPVITGAPTTLPNAASWYNTNVIVHFEATDAVSGVYSVTPDQTLSADGLNQSVDGTAFDWAGNSASTTVTGINIDQTDPGVIITSPTAMVYENTDSFTIAWSVTDALSGVASESGTLDGAPVSNGQLVNLLIVAAGPHTVAVNGVDVADNAASASVTFLVHTDLDGLLASLDYMCSLGWIARGQCQSLRAKLMAAKAAVERGHVNTAENVLDAFINELDAQVGKHVTQQAFDILKPSAEYVIGDL
jgi:hypothetical protein